jgi:hypothetical protein
MGLLKSLLAALGGAQALVAAASLLPGLRRRVRARLFPKMSKDASTARFADHMQCLFGSLVGSLSLLNFLSLGMGKDARFRVGAVNLAALAGAAGTQVALPAAGAALAPALVGGAALLAAALAVNRREPGIFTQDRAAKKAAPAGAAKKPAGRK